MLMMVCHDAHTLLIVALIRVLHSSPFQTERPHLTVR